MFLCPRVTVLSVTCLLDFAQQRNQPEVHVRLAALMGGSLSAWLICVVLGLAWDPRAALALVSVWHLCVVDVDVDGDGVRIDVLVVLVVIAGGGLGMLVVAIAKDLQAPNIRV